MSIVEYVMQHTERGECKCGQCIDVGDKPDPSGQHTVDMVMFKVAMIGVPPAKREDFVKLTVEHFFESTDLFDGKEHNYLELGAWIGSQGLALQYMALGTMLGVFDLLSPKTLMPKDTPEDLMMQMAQAGMISVIVAGKSPL